MNEAAPSRFACDMLRGMGTMLFVVVLFSTYSAAASFTSQADCYNRNESDHGPLSCSVGSQVVVNNDREFAYITNSWLESDYKAAPYEFEIQNEKVMSQSGYVSSFYSLINSERTLATGGTVRPGLISYTFLASDAGSHAVDLQNFMIGNYTFSTIGRSIRGKSEDLVPFQLGSPFDVFLRSEASAHGIDYGTVYGTTILRFRLFEEDGFTPVQLIDTPEPSLAGLTGIAVLVMLWCRSRNGR